MTARLPLAIVGGGPAGLAAAIEAARAGVRAVLFDESSHLGGRIYHPPADPGNPVDARGEALRAEATACGDRIEVRSDTAILGLWGGRDLLWSCGDRTGLVRADRLIVAPGAYDRPVPFPGWTLPGVLTAGAALTFAKHQGVRPGRRALIAGTGPLLPVVAHHLHGAGVEVRAVLEAGFPPRSPRAWLGVWREWDLLREAWTSWRRLRRAGIPLLFHHTVFAAEGDREVERAVWGPVDPRDWRPIHEAGRRAEVDLVISGFGFVPGTELTRLAGCRHRYDPSLGGWVPDVDERMETSVPGLFAAGDGIGIAGARVAVEQGRVAGISAAEQAGALTSEEADRRRAGHRARLSSLAAVRGLLDEMSWIRPGLTDLAQSGTMICRCEEVTRAEVHAAIDAGARDLAGLKMRTRLGMGACQGRQCGPCAAALLCRTLQRAPEAVGHLPPRPPARPVTVGALARMEGAT